MDNKTERELKFKADDVLRRALSAWFRGSEGELRPMPGRSESTVEEHAGKFYVVLRNVNGVLAVYRIRNDGILKGMKRWPLEVEQTLDAARRLESKRPKRKTPTTAKGKRHHERDLRAR